MRTNKKLSLPKPLVDFSNVDTSFADKMKHFDDEKNGRLNLVLVEKSTKSTKSPKSPKSPKTPKTPKSSKKSKTYKKSKIFKTI
tara:strand:- start:2496 stop:2747 length:252 start_codon:yes stop_codon:yes gene_type:complete